MTAVLRFGDIIVLHQEHTRKKIAAILEFFFSLSFFLSFVTCFPRLFLYKYNQLGKKGEEEEKYLFIFFSAATRTALASSAGDKSWEWTDCCNTHTFLLLLLLISFSFSFFSKFSFEKAGVSTGNPSRPARDDNDILFQLLLCRKFHTHGGERIRNTWALLILFFLLFLSPCPHFFVVFLFLNR